MENENLITVSQLCMYYQVSDTFINTLQELGLVEVVTIDDTLYVPKNVLKEIESMIRLHEELNINPEGIDAISHLLLRIHYLHQEVVRLQKRLQLYEG